MWSWAEFALEIPCALLYHALMYATYMYKVVTRHPYLALCNFDADVLTKLHVMDAGTKYDIDAVDVVRPPGSALCLIRFWKDGRLEARGDLHRRFPGVTNFRCRGEMQEREVENFEKGGCGIVRPPEGGLMITEVASIKR